MPWSSRCRCSKSNPQSLRENSEVPPEIAPDEQLHQQIAGLEARLAELQGRLPAHSISPSMQAELDELDEQLAEARRQLGKKARLRQVLREANRQLKFGGAGQIDQLICSSRHPLTDSKK